VLGLLTLEHHNASGNRAAVVKVNVEQPGSDTGAGAEHGRPGRQGGRQPIGAG
jgi:hypothetical protein